MFCGKTYFGYITKLLLMNFLSIVLTMGGVLWLIQALKFKELINNANLGFWPFLELSFLATPSLIMIVLPVALFIAIIYRYHRLVTNSQLVVLKSIGLSNLDLAIPGIVVALATTVFSYIFSFYLLPYSHGLMKDRKFHIGHYQAASFVQAGIFNNQINGVSIYVRELGKNGDFKGIMIYDQRDRKKIVTLFASEGKLIREKGVLSFYLSNGSGNEVVIKSDGKSTASVINFAHYKWTLNLKDLIDIESRLRSPEELYITELFKKNLSGIVRADRLRAEGHHRVIWPLYDMALALVALSFIVPCKNYRMQYHKKLALAVCAGVIVLFLGMGCNSLVLYFPKMFFVPYVYIVVVLLLCNFLLNKSDKTMPT
jgi:lipopolysaccharide export system permease protein